MKKEDLYNGITGVRQEYLEEADDYKPAKAFRWKRWVAVAACLCLLVAGSNFFFPGQKSVSSFVITAYAMEYDGELVGTPIGQNQTAPLTKIKLASSTTMNGFLFSVEMADKNAMSTVSILSDAELTTSKEEVIAAIMKEQGVQEKGMHYFYYVPNAELDVDGFIESITVYHSEVDGSSAEFGLLITRESGKYSATLNSLTSYPVYDPNLPVEGN